MKILCACEYSQTVLKAFLEKGHDVYSCDILPCEGEYPERHFQMDIMNVNLSDYDMIIAFPPCTHLAVSGARHFKKKKESGVQLDAIKFFSYFYNLHNQYPNMKICIENPINIIGGDYIKNNYPEYAYMRKADMITSPHEHGSKTRKKTCFWLWNLEKFPPSNIVKPDIVEYTRKNGRKTTFSKDFIIKHDGHSRSKFTSELAKAMVNAWG